LTHSVDAEFSEEARKAAKKKFLRRFKGTSIVSLIVDSKGQPHEVCVRKLAGFGLDEEAVKAVRQWSFAPAKLNDAPIAVRINVVVQFRTY
jgi:protein TonB